MLHGTIWDEANERARELVRERGLTYIHPFDDLQLIAGQGTVGLEIMEDWPAVDVIVVPIGGGRTHLRDLPGSQERQPRGSRSSESSRPARPECNGASEAGHAVTLDRVDCIIDGLRVSASASDMSRSSASAVDEIVTLPDEQIFEAMFWVMQHCKLVVEGAAAAPVGALLEGLVSAPAGSRVVCVLSGGNVGLDQLRGLRWN